MQLKIVTRGTGIAIIVSFFLTLILSLIYFLTSVQESLFLSLMCTGSGILIGSAVAARMAESRGLLYGITIGIIFFIVTLFVHFLLSPAAPSIGTLIPKLFVYSLSSIIGSVLGVMLKK